MADANQLEILKTSVQEWNKWRQENPTAWVNLREADLSQADLRDADLYKVDLVEADLSRADLRGANLKGSFFWETHFEQAHLENASLEEAMLEEAYLNDAYLEGASLRGAKLKKADLSRADLTAADLSAANLEEASLVGANLQRANLYRAVLSGADLMEADLGWTNLKEADLNRTSLEGTDFYGAELSKTKFIGAFFYTTRLADLDLGQAEGLQEAAFGGPSPINTRAIQRSRGRIPETFLRGCGLSDQDIEYARLSKEGLPPNEVEGIVRRIIDLRAAQAVQKNPLFLSYSRADQPFVDVLEKRLDEKGIRFWRDVHDAAPLPLEKIAERAMRLNPVVLLVLSGQSVATAWVERIALLARQAEKDLARRVLYPLPVDGAWREAKWDERLREQLTKYPLTDFSMWQEERVLVRQFSNLVESLDLFQKG